MRSIEDDLKPISDILAQYVRVSARIEENLSLTIRPKDTGTSLI